MILACEQCRARYLVPPQAIGPGGRTVRCSACQYEWFQEGEESQEAPFAPEEAAPPEPIPESVRPLPEGSELPALPEEVVPPAPARSWGRPAGYAAAAVIFWVLAAALFGLREPLAKIWPPLNGLYELAGTPTVLPGEGLIFDRVKAAVVLDDTGDRVLKLEGAVVNLKDRSLPVPPVTVSLLENDGHIFDRWTFDPPRESVENGADVVFEADYPDIPFDVKEVSVSFGPAPPPIRTPEASHENGHESAEDVPEDEGRVPPAH